MVGEGGYVSLDHFVLWFARVSSGIGSAICVNFVGICRVLAMVFIEYDGCIFMMDAKYMEGTTFS